MRAARPRRRVGADRARRSTSSSPRTAGSPRRAQTWSAIGRRGHRLGREHRRRIRARDTRPGSPRGREHDEPGGLRDRRRCGRGSRRGRPPARARRHRARRSSGAYERGELAGEERGMTTLRVPGDEQLAPGTGAVEPRERRERRRAHSGPRSRPRGTGGHRACRDPRSRSRRRRTRRERGRRRTGAASRRRGSSTARTCRRCPVVPCAHDTIGRDRASAPCPSGATTTPDTAMSRPSTARGVVEDAPRVGPVGRVDAHRADQRARLRLRQRVGHRVEVGLVALRRGFGTRRTGDRDGQRDAGRERTRRAPTSCAIRCHAATRRRRGAGSKRELEHLGDVVDEVERHLVAHRSRARRRGRARCASGRITVGEPGPLRGEHLLLHAADRQHPTLERDLAGHADLGPHRPRPVSRLTSAVVIVMPADGPSFGIAPAGTCRWSAPRVAGAVDAELVGVRPHVRQRDVRRLLHHVTELSGQRELAVSSRVARQAEGRRLDDEHVAAGAGDGEAGRHTGRTPCDRASRDAPWPARARRGPRRRRRRPARSTSRRPGAPPSCAAACRAHARGSGRRPRACTP